MRTGPLALFVLTLSLLSPGSARAQEAARPWIGIGLGTGTQGVLITQVIEEAPGKRAGILTGDELLALDGVPVKTATEVIERVTAKGVGEMVTLTLLRGGKKIETKLALDARPDQLELLRNHLVGKKAPPFALTGLGPHPAKLEALAGNVVVIEFWATWCGPCQTTMPRLSDWQDKYGARGLRVVGVSTEPMATIKHHVERRPVKYTVASDADAAITTAYEVPAVPTFVVIDDKGIVRYVDVGAGSRVDGVETAMKALLH